jgi:aquaporin Z
MKKYIIEFIGAFFLVLTIALSGNPVAIGFVLTALVYMGGYISGGHYNPAVTLTVWLAKKTKPSIALLYMLWQILGGLSAALVYFLITNNRFVPALGVGATSSQALIVEILFTFLLCSVVLHTAATDHTKGNNYFGLAIGLTVMAGAFAGGPVSGGVFNPAVAVGPIMADSAKIGANFNNLLIYLAGPFLGSMIAAVVYKMK